MGEVGMRKYVPEIKAAEKKENTGMRKNTLKVIVNNPESKASEMRKNVPEIVVNDPPEEVVPMQKADLPAESVATQHIGGWKGMNKRSTFDSRALSEAVNVTFKNYPCVESSTVPETVCNFKMIVKSVMTEVEFDESGTEMVVGESLVSDEIKLGEIYDVISRGNELFIAAEAGYVYGKMINGKLCYIPMCEDKKETLYHSLNTEKLMPTADTRCVFTETYNTADSVITIKENICVFSTWELTYDGEKWLPVFPSGSIDFMEKAFLPILWADEADTSRIYVVCDETGKASEVWRYVTGVGIYYNSDSTLDCWVELRRNIYANVREQKWLCLGYFPDDDNYKVSSAEWNANNDNKTYHAGIYLTYIKPTDEKTVADQLNSIDLEELLTDIGVSQTRDNICGLVHFWYGKGVYTSNVDCSYTIKPGIFNYEKTVAPEFEHVTFYKGRVFGSVGSLVICSEYNNYNGWNLDTTDSASSANAWMSTTTANSNADGDIVAMREYLGKISILKTGFMQELYGGSNPFSIQDIYAVGTPFEHGICEAYGRLCFAGRNAIRTYGGSFPRVIGDELGVDVYKDVQMLGDERNLLVKTGDEVYLYDFILGAWREVRSDYFEDAAFFMMLDGEMCMVTHGGGLIKIAGDGYGAWSFTTDAMTESMLAVKRLQKVRITYELGAGSSFKMSIMKSNGNEIATIERTNSEEKTVMQRAEFSLTNAVDWFLKLKFLGSGYFKLISVDMDIKNGSVTQYE